MATRSYADVAPTAATIALNAFIYGYGGHSLVTPHAQLKQRWWTDERIDAKVTRAFIISKLRNEERDMVDGPIKGFGGLTDDSYMEWILERAKRFFLVLNDIDKSDQIFGCIDESWDDDDLPLSLDEIPSLNLDSKNNDALNKRFYDAQFVFMLRELKKGAHIEYGPNEHIPMEHVNTMPPAVCLQTFDRIHFPGRVDDVFMRRKYPLINKETGERFHDRYMRDVRRAKALAHAHIASCWASYTSENAGFVISDFVAEHSIGTYIEHRTPTPYMRVAAAERPVLLCEWMHCLSDALACLHSRGVAHTAIRPSNVWIDKDNRIAFGDVGSISTFQRGKKAGKTEAYDYAAPESHISKRPVVLKSNSPPVSSIGAFSRLRKMSTSTFATIDTVSSSESSSASSIRSNSFIGGTCIGSPMMSPVSSSFGEGRTNSVTTIRTALPPTFESGPVSPVSFTSSRNHSRQISGTCCPSPTIPTGPFSPLSPFSSPASFDTASLLLQRPSTISSASLRDLPTAVPEMGDIWSLACIFLDIITFMLKGKNNEFLKFRATRVQTKNRTRTDTSFHNEPDKISGWISILEEESRKRDEKIYRGVPELLALVRIMMSQNATLRPTARDVRDRIEEILVGECGVEDLCCTDRDWPEYDKNDLKDESTSSRRRTRHDSPLQDDHHHLPMASLSVDDARRKGSDAGPPPPPPPPRGTSVLEKRLSPDHQQAATTTTNATATLAAPQTEVQRRRQSSTSTVTAKVSSWKLKIFHGRGGIAT